MRSLYMIVLFGWISFWGVKEHVSHFTTKAHPAQLKVMPKIVKSGEKQEKYVEPNDGWKMKVEVIPAKKK